MSCRDDYSAAFDRYQYSHNETATIRVYSSPLGSPPSLNSHVLLESTSTLRSSTPIFHHQGNGNWDISDGATLNGTPFSEQVLELLSRFPLQRLLIRVGNAAASTGGIGLGRTDDLQLLQDERARGPSGTSVIASFVRSLDTHHNSSESEELKIYYQNQYASLLRYLLDNTLFPPCGAPLDSVRVRKHGHSLIVKAHPFSIHNDSTFETVDVESSLAADGATFCNPGIQSFILSQRENTKAGVGWGTIAHNGACHPSDTRGLFESLFASSSGENLSQILLGSSRDSSPWVFGSGDDANKRNSMWVDLQVSSSCFVSLSDQDKGEKCSLTVTRGVSYRVALPTQAQKITTGDSTDRQKVSLGDLLIGHHMLQHSRASEKEGLKVWYPCPMSDSSRLIIYLPKGYVAKLEDAIKPLSITGFDHDRWFEERMEFNILASKDGFVDLTTPWTMLGRDNENIITSSSSTLYGISRTVHHPSGISSSGTLVSVLRSETLGFDSDKSKIVKVQSLDVFPGEIIKPMMRSFRMTLYQGSGAGGARFVPPVVMFDNHHCECLQTNFAESCNIEYAVENDCGSVSVKDVNLSQLQDHKLTLNPDGTILLERTVLLQPNSSLWMTVDFEEAYLPFQKFPADANRGVDIFPSKATFTLISPSLETMSPSVTIYSQSLVILPPVPDMSMPFNVISLSCTLWAFVLGSLLNTLVRRGTESVKRELTGEKEKRPIDKVKEKLGKMREAMRRIIRGNRAGNSKPDENVDQMNKKSV